MVRQKPWKHNPKTDYPSYVSDEEWVLVTPYLTLMAHDAPQREYLLRVVFNALSMPCAGSFALWHMMPNDSTPWQVIYQQPQCWIYNSVFELRQPQCIALC